MNKDLTKKLNDYLANLGIEYIKLHNLHWNVVGLSFKAVHEYFESLYDETTDFMDAIAELLRINDELPLASVKDFLTYATVKEIESKEISVSDALKTVFADLELLKNQALDAHKKAEEDGLTGVVATLEEQINYYDKQLWFIKSMLK